MRICESCARADSCVVDAEIPCDRALCPPDADERAETHHDRCPKLTHEVRALYRVAKLIHTPSNPAGELSAEEKRKGWKIRRDGTTTYRYRMLCRLCVQELYFIEARHADYLKACRKALGQDDQTYSQFLSQQCTI